MHPTREGDSRKDPQELCSHLGRRGRISQSPASLGDLRQLWGRGGGWQAWGLDLLVWEMGGQGSGKLL